MTTTKTNTIVKTLYTRRIIPGIDTKTWTIDSPCEPVNSDMEYVRDRIKNSVQLYVLKDGVLAFRLNYWLRKIPICFRYDMQRPKSVDTFHTFVDKFLNVPYLWFVAAEIVMDKPDGEGMCQQRQTRIYVKNAKRFIVKLLQTRSDALIPLRTLLGSREGTLVHSDLSNAENAAILDVYVNVFREEYFRLLGVTTPPVTTTASECEVTVREFFVPLSEEEKFVDYTLMEKISNDLACTPLNGEDVSYLLFDAAC